MYKQKIIAVDYDDTITLYAPYPQKAYLNPKAKKYLNKLNEKEIINAPLELQQQFASFVLQIDKSKFEIWRYLKFSDIMKRIGFILYD